MTECVLSKYPGEVEFAARNVSRIGVEVSYRRESRYDYLIFLLDYKVFVVRATA